MSFFKHLKDRFRRDRVTLQLDDIQALILRSRPEPYVGIHAMLHVDEAEGGRDLIARLAEYIPSASDWADDLSAWTGVAISHAGLKALGLPEDSLASFPLAFRQGMAGRATQLHDFGENAPETWEDAYRNDTCHIALTIYAADKPALDVAVEKAMAEFDASTGVTLVGTHEFGADEDAENPFGFRDSISQPTVAGAGVDPQPGQERAIAAGEFVLGENSETGEPISMPSPDPLGRNGSFVVLRKYDSRVGAFNEFLRAQTGDAEAQHALAAKMFGRWRSGAPLPLSPARDDPDLGADRQRNNDFDFKGDVRGFVCPHSSHMRRMNPRGGDLTILTDENIHRIIRRSSTFGPKWTPDVTAAEDRPDERGLFFIFISARAYDTVEFLQQEWINRGNFIDLGTEPDPIVGLHEEPGRFTIPADPVRRRIDGVTTFNRLRGGEYMFMPSLTALRWIGSEGWAG
ncbi:MULTISPECIES: Dyp-type peroxidase [Hyphomicrobiales]|jgi:Dyp-type peroxidase family|uniref:Dyp-type peroxidase family n=2 Tax=Brucella/Ochrobactrum group TaxID=2826938 RepID=A6X835_BRUA4|nr:MULTISPECIES: Dyp-type peroxidase [Hyphomicrobiales]AIH15740.1 peroxidase [Ochrobactrum sp. SJY1]PZU71214.1 MAG: Dyp-type peroxidase [Rhizobium sp.]CUX67763.1 Dyp-type peroxidase family [Agrobacterium genomosp. 5 str. CFBP 6626]HCD83801.1 Dyp-type peroxidase [Agrobacterium sp.]ABS17389.1 Dyp-type peroxidase family [Brucella anthropi ATCC 49188]